MGTTWSGVLDDVEFLGRLYDLDALPSTDRRCSSAGGDIFMHRVMNPMDWDEDWVFHDSRFGLADSDEALVRFLAEMLHPVVRTDLAEVEELRAFLNSVLVHDGYERPDRCHQRRPCLRGPQDRLRRPVPCQNSVMGTDLAFRVR
jgi:AbiJ N-terminal domain 3